MRWIKISAFVSGAITPLTALAKKIVLGSQDPFIQFGALASSTGSLIVAHYPTATPAVIACAIAGSTVYVVFNGHYTLVRQAALFIVSFIAGVVTCNDAAAIVAGLIGAKLDVSVDISPAFGALVSSATSVTILVAGKSIISRIGGQKNDP